ncbi:MAG: DUF4131 domain-containing protein, partial [Acidobacteriota bacterium]|nr:DUF4131 domain-containing protein [Acidobacteriota bacterium]
MRAVSHRLPFNSHPLAVLAAAFACGLLLVRMVAPASGVERALLCLVGGVCCAGVSAWALRKQKFYFATWCVAVGFACAGAALAAAEASRVSGNRVRGFFESGRIASGDPVEVTGVLGRAPEVAPDGFYMTLRVEGLRHKGVEQRATGAVQLFAPVRDEAARAAYAELALRRGARVRVLVALERSERYRNPGGSSFVEFLEQRELDAVGT